MIDPTSWRIALALLFCATASCLSQAARADAPILPSSQSRTDDQRIERPPGMPSDPELEAAGARIGSIRIQRRDLFDLSRADENTALFRLGNRLHIETREATIANQLLFRSGEPYVGRILQESERLLRTTRYLRDATIVPVALRDGVVDIEVITEDVWTFNPGVSFGRKGGSSTSGFELEELNLLGLGIQISLGVKSGVDRDSKLVVFRDRQLGRSWWGLDAQFADNSDGRVGELKLERPFYSLDTRWAAGIAVRDDERIDSRYDLGNIIDQYEVGAKLFSAYVGRSTGLRDGWTTRYKLGFTFDENRFDPIGGTAPTRLLPSDRKLAYPWVAMEWLQDEFREDSNRDQIGRTEDVTLGWRARAQLGYAGNSVGSDVDAAMLSAAVAKGVELTARQTLQFEAAAAGRIEGGDLVGGLLSAEARYYFRQSPRRVLFMGLSTLAGSNLDPDQQILLGGDSGLRGYPLRYQAGTGRWLFTAEQRFYSNWYPFRLFNVGGAAFFDVGETWGRDPLGAPSRGLLKDVGVGLRLGNSRSALGNVVHVDLAVPLDGDASIKDVQFLIETKRSF